MANKRASSPEDPLKPFMIYIPESQLLFLKTLGKSASGYVRSLIAAQMGGHEAEISKLEEENRQYEAHININKAQINELSTVHQRQQTASRTRDELIENITDRLTNNRVLNFNDRVFVRKFENNLEDANRALNGDGTPITHDELKKRTIMKAEAREKIVYD